MRIRKLLVPTDFSECANDAARLAILLARRSRTEIVFLHLYVDPIGLHHGALTALGRHQDPEVTYVRHKLDELVAEAGRAGVMAQGTVVIDKGIDALDSYVNSYGADMVVMGSNGVQGIAGWLAGSNAQRVSRHAAVPVLVIKRAFTSDGLRNIVFASSFDEEDVTAPLRWLADLAGAWDATIHLLYVSLAIHTVNLENARQRMEACVRAFPGIRFTINFSEINDEEKAIASTARRLGADLVALTPHERDGKLRLLSHSIAEQLVRHGELPVMVLPEAEQVSHL